jgi:hypothetical protein
LPAIVQRDIVRLHSVIYRRKFEAFYVGIHARVRKTPYRRLGEGDATGRISYPQDRRLTHGKGGLRRGSRPIHLPATAPIAPTWTPVTRPPPTSPPRMVPVIGSAIAPAPIWPMAIAPPVFGAIPTDLLNIRLCRMRERREIAAGRSDGAAGR